MGGFGVFRLLYSKDNPSNNPTANTTTLTTKDLVSGAATNPQLISQEEKILLGSKTGMKPSPNMNKLHNAKARQAGNLLTMAAVVPITQSPDSAKEILRGVASYQQEFHQSPPLDGRLLEIVVVNADEPRKGSSLAQDLVRSNNILGVLGHGIDPGSQQALRKYDKAGLAALSPLTTNLTPGEKKSILKIIPIDEKAEQLLGDYLAAVSCFDSIC